MQRSQVKNKACRVQWCFPAQLFLFCLSVFPFASWAITLHILVGRIATRTRLRLYSFATYSHTDSLHSGLILKYTHETLPRDGSGQPREHRPLKLISGPTKTRTTPPPRGQATTRPLAAVNMSNNTILDEAMLPSVDGLEREPCNWSGTLCDDDGNAYLSQEQRKARARKAIKGIHELYKAGVLFFSKAAIQDLVRQMDRTTDLVCRFGRTAGVESERFILRGLDGEEARFRMETGEAQDVGDGRRELVKYVVSSLLLWPRAASSRGMLTTDTLRRTA